ncbi:MAG: FAD-dependent oxidoreductase, partial [Gammaproteobacteria bacterium]
MKQKLVLVGNGMAGVRTLEELLKIAPEHYDITVFGAEPYGNYNRIMLSPLLAGEKTVADIMLNDEQWYIDNGISLYTGKQVTRIDRARRRVIAEDGTSADYDRLLIATGSNPFMIPVPGRDKDGVIAFRDINDVDTMLAAAHDYKKAVVIGGGLLGLEAANGLMKQGMEVTVVHLLDSLMERQLDKPASSLLKASLEERGMNFLMEAQTAEIIGNGRVQGIRFKDGSKVTADLVVMGVGIVPNIELAKNAGLHCERGIVVNDVMQTFDPRIYAVGECAQHRGIAYGLVAPLFEQGKVAANQL